MIARITPSHLSGTVTAPPSKSMAHPHLICVALAEGCSTVHGVADSEDVKATVGGDSFYGSNLVFNGDLAS